MCPPKTLAAPPPHGMVSGGEAFEGHSGQRPRQGDPRAPCSSGRVRFQREGGHEPGGPHRPESAGVVTMDLAASGTVSRDPPGPSCATDLAVRFVTAAGTADTQAGAVTGTGQVLGASCEGPRPLEFLAKVTQRARVVESRVEKALGA